MGDGTGEAVAGTVPRRFQPGIDDLIIVPLAVLALVASRLLRLVLAILVQLLDYAFPVLLQVVRFPLFTLRIIGDGAAGLFELVVAYLPISSSKRDIWRSYVARRWTWLRQKISYQAFEQALHHAFERGMGWVFRRCRKLTPTAALLVIAAAVLWLPISFGAATALHTVLIAEAKFLPAWMQLLHPLGTFIAKSKLLVLPVYPAAWPQAKRHPLVQRLFGLFRYVTGLEHVQKTASRYGDASEAAAQLALAMSVAARRVGFSDLLAKMSDAANTAAAALGRGVMQASNRLLAGLCALPLIGSVLKRYEACYCDAQHRPAARASQQMRGFFERWSIKFSPEYYEAKERGTAAKQAESG